MHRNFLAMARHCIYLTESNDKWLNQQVEAQKSASKSELINDLISDSRKKQDQLDWICAKLDRAEESGFTEDSKEQILRQSKSALNG